MDKFNFTIQQAGDGSGTIRVTIDLDGYFSATLCESINPQASLDENKRAALGTLKTWMEQFCGNIEDELSKG